MLKNILAPFYYLNRKATRHMLGKAMAKRGPVARPGKNLLYLAAVCLPYHINGYAVRTHAILKALREQGTEALALSRPGYPWDRSDSLAKPNSAQTTHEGIDYHHLAHPTRVKHVVHYALAGASEIEKFVLANDVGLIHAASNHINALPGLIAAKRLGLPFQYEMRGIWELSRASRIPSFYNSPPFRLALELEGMVASSADRLFTISGQLAEYAIKRWRIDPSKIQILPNCCEIPKSALPPSRKVEPGLLGYAGSLVEYEGLDIVLEALAHLRNNGKIAHLRIIGDGEARERLEALSEKLGLEGQVKFWGRVEPERAKQMLLECEAICLARKPYEVCKIIPPLKLVEAMSMGKPLFAPDLPVFREELGESGAGWLFEAGNAASLAKLLAARLPDKAGLLEQGAKLRAKAFATRQWKHFAHLIPYPQH